MPTSGCATCKIWFLAPLFRKSWWKQTNCSLNLVRATSCNFWIQIGIFQECKISAFFNIPPSPRVRGIRQGAFSIRKVGAARGAAPSAGHSERPPARLRCAEPAESPRADITCMRSRAGAEGGERPSEAQDVAHLVVACGLAGDPLCGADGPPRCRAAAAVDCTWQTW